MLYEVITLIIKHSAHIPCPDRFKSLYFFNFGRRVTTPGIIYIADVFNLNIFI